MHLGVGIGLERLNQTLHLHPDRLTDLINFGNLKGRKAQQDVLRIWILTAESLINCKSAASPASLAAVSAVAPLNQCGCLSE